VGKKGGRREETLHAASSGFTRKKEERWIYSSVVDFLRIRPSRSKVYLPCQEERSKKELTPRLT